MDVPIDYHVWGTKTYYAETLSKTHAKTSQHKAKIEDRFVDDTEWFASRVDW